MEKKDLVPNESNADEITPLITESKDDVATTAKTSLSHLASELSELSLKVASKATSTTLGESANQQEADDSTPESTPSTEPVEDVAAEEAPDDDEHPPVDEPQDRSETESPLDSEVENQPWLDHTMYMLILEVLLLAFPISMTYFGIAYFKHCIGGDKLPMLLLILAFLSSLTLIGRILINVAKKQGFYDRDIFPPMAIYSGEFIVMVLYIAEVIYLITMEKRLCSDTLYLYTFYMNNVAAGLIVILFFYNLKKILRCVSILLE